MPNHRFTLYGDTTYIIPRPTPANTTRLPKETKVYFNPFFITFLSFSCFQGTKIVNLFETAKFIFISLTKSFNNVSTHSFRNGKPIPKRYSRHHRRRTTDSPKDSGCKRYAPPLLAYCPRHT